jgi:hypothetical protein
MTLSLRFGRTLAAGLLACSSLALPALPAQAATSAACDGGDFRVILPNSQLLSGYKGFKLPAGQVAPQSTIQVRGRYTEFDVNVSTLAVTSYTLTGAANPFDLTGGVRTPVFASKVADLKGRTLDAGELEVTLSPQSVLVQRKASGVSLKIQAKDCATGGVFQMEPETGGGTIITHTLAPGAFYFTNPFTGKVNFGTGGLLRGKDSPQVATRLEQTSSTTVWSVASGGRLGMVLGEDGVELSAGASPCVQQCQAQEQIRGSLPVTDPFFTA